MQHNYLKPHLGLKFWSLRKRLVSSFGVQKTFFTLPTFISALCPSSLLIDFFYVVLCVYPEKRRTFYFVFFKRIPLLSGWGEKLLLSLEWFLRVIMTSFSHYRSLPRGSVSQIPATFLLRFFCCLFGSRHCFTLQIILFNLQIGKGSNSNILANSKSYITWQDLLVFTCEHNLEA